MSCDSLVLQGLGCEWGAGVLNLVLSLSLSHTGHWKFNMAKNSLRIWKKIVALHKDGVGQGKATLVLEGRCPAEFSSNPNQHTWMSSRSLESYRQVCLIRVTCVVCVCVCVCVRACVRVCVQVKSVSQVSLVCLTFPAVVFLHRPRHPAKESNLAYLIT